MSVSIEKVNSFNKGIDQTYLPISINSNSCSASTIAVSGNAVTPNYRVRHDRREFRFIHISFRGSEGRTELVDTESSINKGLIYNIPSFPVGHFFRCIFRKMGAFTRVKQEVQLGWKSWKSWETGYFQKKG